MTTIIDERELWCSVCLSLPEYEVFQCGNGHLVCSSCIHRLPLQSQCPTCKIQESFVRCPAVERIVQGLPWECEYKCGLKLSIADSRTHLCQLKPFPCPCCQIQVRSRDFTTHATRHLSGGKFKIPLKQLKRYFVFDRDRSFVNIGNTIVCLGTLSKNTAGQMFIEVIPVTSSTTDVFFSLVVRVNKDKVMRTYHEFSSQDCNRSVKCLVDSGRIAMFKFPCAHLSSIIAACAACSVRGPVEFSLEAI
jgi:hypothetical protein